MSRPDWADAVEKTIKAASDSGAIPRTEWLEIDDHIWACLFSDNTVVIFESIARTIKTFCPWTKVQLKE